MHRRNRHIVFSAKSAGAIIVLDARSIKGVANNGSVTSWVDLSTRTRNFTGAAAPTYKTNIQGGQPAVSFDGVNDYLSVSWLTSENPSQYVWIGTEVPRTINANKHLVSTSDGSFNAVNFSFAHTTTNLVGTNVRPPSFDFYPATISVNTPNVQSLGYNGTQLFFYRGNFASSTGVTLSTTTTFISLGGRNGCCDYDTSDLMQFLLFNSFISKSLRRRFEIASFFTFKIKDTQNNTNR
jgi:hypothetical protein